jgi:hypothetical protein
LQDGAVYHFIVKKNMPLAKVNFAVSLSWELIFFLQLMETFCRHQSFDLRSIRFMFEGNSVSSSSTPEGLGMEDGDEIDAFLSQVGGEHERRHDE